jgi:hypothetical protein
MYYSNEKRATRIIKKTGHNVIFNSLTKTFYFDDKYKKRSSLSQGKSMCETRRLFVKMSKSLNQETIFAILLSSTLDFWTQNQYLRSMGNPMSYQRAFHAKRQHLFLGKW